MSSRIIISTTEYFELIIEDSSLLIVYSYEIEHIKASLILYVGLRGLDFWILKNIRNLVYIRYLCEWDTEILRKGIISMYSPLS